jgi:hypothetical protein
MLRAASSRLLATVTSTMAASGTLATTIAMTVSRMIITSTSRFGWLHRSAWPAAEAAFVSIRCSH